MPRPDRSSSPDRAAKVARIQQATASAERRRGAVIWGSAALVVALIVGAVTWAIVGDRLPVQAYEYQAADHTTEPVDYEEQPPVGGPHHPAWWNCGVYADPVPAEHAVHSLEHGAVWLTYSLDLPADQVEVLTDLGRQDYMLVSPNPEQDSPVVATAWGHQMTLEEADRGDLTRFIGDYKQGPQTPEPGAACTGGTTENLVAGS